LRMMAFVLFCLLALSACVDFSGIQSKLGNNKNNAPSWDEKVKSFSWKEHYICSFPAEPFYMETFFGNGGNQYSTTRDGVQYSVAEGIDPFGMPDPYSKQELIFEELSKQNVEKWAKGKENSHYSIGLEGGKYPGRHIEGNKSDGGAFILNIFIDPPGKRFFLVGVQGPKAKIASSSCSKFLDSFHVWAKKAS